MGTSTPYAKKTDGSCARFGRDLSSTSWRYDSILEFWCMFQNPIWGASQFMRVKMGSSTPYAKEHRW
jgi:hypothetical protein